MKQILLSFLLSFSAINAQKVLIEKGIEKDRKTVTYFYDSVNNNFFIGYGRPNGGLVGGDQINEICLYDSNGNETKFLENQKLYGLAFSCDGKSFITADISKGALSAKTKLFSFDKKEVEILRKNLKEIQLSSFLYGKKIDFSSSTFFNLTNKKGELEIDLSKDKNLKLNTFDMFTLKKEIIDLEPLNIDRLNNSSTIKSKARLGVNFKAINDNSFSLITKSISKDYTKCNLYKTIYSRNGKILEDINYEIDLKSFTLLHSRNNGGEISLGGYEGKFTHFADDNFINQYYEDRITGDFYVYGLFGDDISPINTQGNPKGFYVFKFDAKGNKIWESINKISESDFNRDHAMPTVYTNFFEINDKVCFTIEINGLKDFFMYSTISKRDGSLSNLAKLNFNQTFAHLENVPSNEYKINEEYKNDKLFADKVYSFKSIIAINTNKKIFEYIKNRSSNSNLSFTTYFDKNQVWLFEQDKSSFRIVLFED